MRRRWAAERSYAVVAASGRSASACTATRSAWKRSGARSWPRCASGTRPVRGDLRARLRRSRRDPGESPDGSSGARRPAARRRQRRGTEPGQPSRGDARAARRLGGSGMPWRPRRHARRAGGGALLRGPGGRGRSASTARARGDHQAAGRARSADGRAPAWSRDPGHPPGGFMNALTPYAAFFMRLAVGGVFLVHGVSKFHRGIPVTTAFLHDIGFPFAVVFAILLIAVETIGAACVVLGIFTRFWAVCMALEMLVAILAVKLPHSGNIELEGLLFAGAITLVALGDGPLSIAVKLKHSST